MTSLRIVGTGRAGTSFALALGSVGYDIDLVGRGDSVATAAQDVDGVLIAVPDRAVREVAASIRPSAAVVLHCSGVTTLEALHTHEHRAGVHPLMALPTPEVGAARLADNGWFGIAGNDVVAMSLATQIVNDLGGRSFEIDDEHRSLYHATAAVSANHLVALLAQVERLADQAGVPAQAFFDLARGSFDDVIEHGARTALTGPAARGDASTIAAHLGALPEGERDLYQALMRAAQRLADPT